MAGLQQECLGRFEAHARFACRCVSRAAHMQYGAKYEPQGQKSPVRCLLAATLQGRDIVATDNDTYYGIAQRSAPVYCFPWEYTFPAPVCPKPRLLLLPLQKSGTFHFNFTLTRPVMQVWTHTLRGVPGTTAYR